MFDYTICPNNSSKEFKKTCDIIEKTFPDVKKHRILIDVDGSTIQTYTKDDKEIDVYDDYEVGAVYVKSELDLYNVFN